MRPDSPRRARPAISPSAGHAGLGLLLLIAGGAVEVPLAEEFETYEVEILDGAAVKRALSAATTSAIYIAAQQTADRGAPLGPGDTLDIRIFQLSALVGRGAPKTVTLIL